VHKTKVRTASSRFYSYAEALYKSFYSKELYRDVLQRWRGAGFLYLLLMISILILPMSIMFTLHYNHAINESILNVMNKIPPLMIQNGNIIFDKPMPYEIKNDKGEVKAIIDTTGKINTINENHPHLGILIKKNEIVVKLPTTQFLSRSGSANNSLQLYTQKIPANDNEIFDTKQWVSSKGIDSILWLSRLTIYPIVLSFFLGIFIVFIYILAFIGQLIAIAFFEVSINYKSSSRLLSVSSTPALFILCLAFTFNNGYGLVGMFFLLLLIGYYCFALLVNKPKKGKFLKI
jgi:hypothetical protein